jgi:hypothetical protein
MREHRQRLVAELADAGASGRLCVLGAGNCNDLDLGHLTQMFSDVHLTDVDGDAIAKGVQRQRLPARARIYIHGDAELTGLTFEDGQRSLSEDPAALVARFSESAQSFAGPTLPGPFDCVISTCVLSQILCGLVTWIGLPIESVGDLLLAVRNRHIDIALNNTCESGVALVVCDMVSDDTAPCLKELSPGELPAVRERLIAESNFFHGTNPHAIVNYVERAHRDVHVELRPPWLWSVGRRTFLVNALRLRR